MAMEPYDSKTKGTKTPPWRFAKEPYLMRFCWARSSAAERWSEAAERTKDSQHGCVTLTSMKKVLRRPTEDISGLRA